MGPSAQSISPSIEADHPARIPGADHLDEISCDGCGRSFNTPDGVGMMAVIKGPCPDCGGTFEFLAAA